MNPRKVLPRLCIATAVVSLPFTILPLLANPDDAPISPLQHVSAAIANFFGPWGVVLVRSVEFPNAGLRSFSWTLSITLTVVGAVLLLLAIRQTRRYGQYVLIGCWTIFSVVWFAVGFLQIANGLL